MTLRLWWSRRLLAVARRCNSRAEKLIERSNECIEMAARHHAKVRAGQARGRVG